ncbi:TIGR01459 family HAD-type hydrolase [Rhodovulum adriaticum]|uniref:HAD superfamily hydrolase (TIGR01459 family) n=1 Tax=Rhodovulum adriaticum TaxID=35804 RepID=A0A4R2NWL9_RHOAD|nr:TIGR01459 family HAD-type hydrolase [Rhodovulum adriaticum]MBK1635271.1 TIGR01459 family HAD-type hydrolase [Rhodovulum adriaticum]TCP26407.1 HAD superfamily hydrolase (TIGR01459 family) [Rhodovulum adriaticum]
MTQIIESLDTVSARYKAMFVDIWGCVHDGEKPFAEAVDALQRYRAGGGIVVLVTNAPRHRNSVAAQLDKIGVARDAWDTIATSGDSARAAMYRGAVGEKVFFMGEDHDMTFFDPLKIIENPVPITRVPLEQAEGIVCTGPFDVHADPSELRPQLLYAKAKGLKLLCANPDIVVDRGEVREWCAGAVARLYTEMGGESLYFGKPHPPIYDLARRRLAQIADVPDTAILCVGDGIHTDIAGAMGEDLDSLFITGGLAAAETKTDRQPDPAALDAFLQDAQFSPTYSIGYLR